MAWESFGKKTVTTAGTIVRITATSTPCNAIMIQALSTNTGKMYVGRSTLVTSTLVGALAVVPIPGTNTLPSVNVSVLVEINGLNLWDYWLDSDVNGEGVLVSYLVI